MTCPILTHLLARNTNTPSRLLVRQSHRNIPVYAGLQYNNPSLENKFRVCLKSIIVDASLQRITDAQSGTFVPSTGYLGIGKDDLLPNGDLNNKYLARVLIKAFKVY